MDCRNELPNEQQNRVPGVGTTCREPDPPDNFITFKPLTHSPTTRFPSPPMTTTILAYTELRDLVSRSTFLPTMAVLVGILAALLLIGFWIRSRFHEITSENAADPEELLVLYEEMRRQGDLTDEEFRSIKSRILPSRSHDVQKDT